MATPTNLPGVITTGDVLTATYLNNMRGSFRVLQVISATTSTQQTNATTTFADTTLTATITPQSATSNILVFANHLENYKTSANVNNAMNLRLVRGATTLVSAASLGSTATASDLVFSSTLMWLDSPATTSATTYKTQFSNAVAASDVRVQAFSVPSSIILLEISA